MNDSEARTIQPTEPTQPTQPTPPALPPRTSSSASTDSKTEKPGSLIGSKIKGIARIIHGAGEAVRGYSMSALDNTISTKARGAEENGEITRRGQDEIQRGLDDIKWKGSSSDQTTTT